MSTPKKAPRTPVTRKTSSARQTSPQASLGLDDVKLLLALVSKEGVSEFEYETPTIHLRIRKDGPQSAAQMAPLPTAPMPSPIYLPSIPSPTVVAPTVAPTPAASAPSVETPADEVGVHYITSPIVGTFYRSSNPNSAPFVQVGDRVKAGQTLCIVEAMKLMNEIECDVAGEVVKVLVENGQPVEYGERLYAVRLG